MKQVVKHAPDVGRQRAEKGIIAPEPELLDVGECIYRFASSNRATFGYQAGEWWIREADFNEIVERARRKGVDLGQKARWDLAVLPSWGSKMNVVVKARVKGRLWAWVGLAKPQMELTPNGRAIHLYGNRDIRQLFIDDVIKRDAQGRTVALSPRSWEALAIIGAQAIPSAPIS